jgi:hypothetical protein
MVALRAMILNRNANGNAHACNNWAKAETRKGQIALAGVP